MAHTHRHIYTEKEKKREKRTPGSSKDVERVGRGLLLGEGHSAPFWKTLCACVIFFF